MTKWYFYMLPCFVIQCILLLTLLSCNNNLLCDNGMYLLNNNGLSTQSGTVYPDMGTYGAPVLIKNYPIWDKNKLCANLTNGPEAYNADTGFYNGTITFHDADYSGVTQCYYIELYVNLGLVLLLYVLPFSVFLCFCKKAVYESSPHGRY